MKTFKILWTFFTLALVVGCSPPSFTAVIPQGKGKEPITVTQNGAALTPSKVSIKAERKSENWFSKLVNVEKISHDFPKGEESADSRVVEITGPQSYAPPAPPTAEEKAWATVVVLSAIAGAAFFVAAGAALYFEHGKAALVLGVTGLALPVVAKLLTTEWVVIVGVVGSLVAGVLFAAWHFVKHKIPIEYGGMLPPTAKSGLSL